MNRKKLFNRMGYAGQAGGLGSAIDMLERSAAALEAAGRILDVKRPAEEYSAEKWERLRKLFNRMGYAGQAGRLGDLLFALQKRLRALTEPEEDENEYYYDEAYGDIVWDVIYLD